jgi:hypothetical protein
MAPSSGEGAAAAVAAAATVAAAAAARPSAADTAQARYMAKLKVMIDAKKAFHAGTDNKWEHYVDRESGAEWWLNAATLEIMSEDPASDPGSRVSSHCTLLAD